MDKQIISNIWKAFQEVQRNKLSKDSPEDNVEETKIYDSGWKKSKQYKDRYGNVVKQKNIAKHLAKKGLSKVQSQSNSSKTEETNMTKEESQWLSNLAAELLAGYSEKIKEASDRAKHTKGATKPEGIMDKESPKSKEFAKMHMHPGDTSHKHFDVDEKGHDDVSKAGRAVKSQAPARNGADNLKNGDTKPVK